MGAKNEIDGIPILGGGIPVKAQKKEGRGADKKVNPQKDKDYFKCMDCNFKFKDLAYKERPRCPYCANNNTVKTEAFFNELI